MRHKCRLACLYTYRDPPDSQSLSLYVAIRNTPIDLSHSLSHLMAIYSTLSDHRSSLPTELKVAEPIECSGRELRLLNTWSKFLWSHFTLRLWNTCLDIQFEEKYISAICPTWQAATAFLVLSRPAGGHPTWRSRDAHTIRE